MSLNLNFNEFKFSHKVDTEPVEAEGFQYHAHNLYEILLFNSGDIEYVIENHRYKLKPNDLLIIKPGEHHYLNLLSTKAYDRMVFRFPDYFVPQVIANMLDAKPTLFNIQDKDILEIFKRFDRLANKFTGERLYLLCMNNLSDLLIYLTEVGDSHHELHLVNENIENILAYINENIKTPLSVNDICSKFYISKTKLYKIFYDAMKIPIAQYIRNKKIMLAYSLIKRGQKPTQVYEEVGFNDYSTFYRTYIKVVGSSPSDKE